MTTWKLLYENRFPANAKAGDVVVDFPRAAAGTQTVQSGPVFELFTGLPGFGIGEGRNLTYRPTDLLADVIGIDVTMDFVFIALSEERPLTLFSTETAGLSATLAAVGPPTLGDNVACRLTLRLADILTTVEGLSFRRPFGDQTFERRRLQVRWATNGQLHVFLDGLLIAYENAVKPGHRFNLSRLSIGDVELPTTPVVNAAVANVRLVELRENSAVESLGEQFEPEYVPRIPERCQKRAQSALEQLLREARTLMAGFNASKTSSWRQADGGSPFTSASLTAHKAGSNASAAFARYLRDGTPEARTEVVSNLRDILQILAADQPALFRALVVKSDEARNVCDPDCAGVAYAIRSANPRLFEKLDPLGAELDELIHDLGGS